MDTIKHIEDKIKLLLVMQGYDKKEIRFKNSSGGRILQYGYWKYLDSEDMIYIQDNANVILIPREWEDEDTGNLVGYEIKVK